MDNVRMSPFSNMIEMMKIAADDRGYADHGWLQARHTFSFGEYYHPDRSGFGALRVLNDDIVHPGQGFGTHPHRNMEIITIPLSGSIQHEDSTGSSEVTSAGQVQVMSAGTGIRHSEFNASDKVMLNLLQVWIEPNVMNIPPRYEQIDLPTLPGNDWLYFAGPGESTDEHIKLNQNAWMALGEFDSDSRHQISMRDPANILLVMVIEGEVKIMDEILSVRDAAGIRNGHEALVHFRSLIPSRLLLIEIPEKK